MEKEELKPNPKAISVVEKLGFQKFMEKLWIKHGTAGVKFIVDFTSNPLGEAYMRDSVNQRWDATGIGELETYLRERDIALMEKTQEIPMKKAAGAKFDKPANINIGKPAITSQSARQAPTDSIVLQGIMTPQVSPLMVSPVVSIDKAVELFRLFEEAKVKLLSENDVMWFGSDGKSTEKGKGKPHIKRSGWRKLARFFGLSCAVLKREKIISQDDEGPFYIWAYHVKVMHPSGAYQDAEGTCSSRDPFFSMKRGLRVTPEESNIIHTAQTIAFNRAIADLLGCGDISAEEIETQ